MNKENFEIKYENEVAYVEKKWEDFDPNLVYDGGSYYQPFYTVKFRDKTMLINDSSCGNFGSHISVDLCDEHGNIINMARYGSMLSDGEKYTDFPALSEYVALAGELGYVVPTRSFYRVCMDYANVADARTLEELPVMSDNEVFEAVMLQGGNDPIVVAKFDDLQAAEDFFNTNFKFYGHTRPVKCVACWIIMAYIAYIEEVERSNAYFESSHVIGKPAVKGYNPEGSEAAE